MPYGTYQRNTFIDSAPGGLGAYSWTINHNEEGESGSARNIEATANTSGNIAVRQQGEDSPRIIHLQGTILTREQDERFTAYFEACRDRTITFVDFYGQELEVQITSYQPTRKRVARNPRDPAMLLHVIDYTMDLTVYATRTGPWS